MGRTIGAALRVATDDQIVAMVQEAAPVPMSTREITDRLPLRKGTWSKPHHPCPTCSCEPVWQAYWHEGARVSNHEVTGLLKRLERLGQVERFRSPVRGQPDSWRWIGDGGGLMADQDQRNDDRIVTE